MKTILLGAILTIIFYSLAGIQDVRGDSLINEDSLYASSLPSVIVTPECLLLVLPNEIDNSTRPYFPNDGNFPLMWHQDTSGSCVAVACIYYTYTYEYNRLNNQSGNIEEHRFAPNSLWNFFNNGNYGIFGGTQPISYHQALKRYGVMTEAAWGNRFPQDYLRWPTGFNTWHQMGMHKVDYYNGVKTISTANSYESLESLKYFLAYHSDGSAVGGIAHFSVGYWEHTPSKVLPSVSAYPNEHIKVPPTFAGESGHHITVVGYSEDVKYDWGGALDSNGNVIPDGIFDNAKDNNFDGVIDLHDCEIGAIKIADNYGNQGNQGFEWVSYSLIAGEKFYALYPVNSSPQLALKVNISHPKRGHLLLNTVKRPAANSTLGGAQKDIFELMDGTGGNNPIQGYLFNGDPDNPSYTIINEPIETVIDRSTYCSGTNLGKVYLLFRDYPYIPDEQGYIIDLSLVDYRWGEEFELISQQHNIPITGNNQNLSFEYDLIKQGPQGSDITLNTLFSSNKVSRFNPRVTNNSTLTIGESVKIDMYNSNITIDPGAKIELSDDVYITAKRGYNSITINGEIQVGYNVHFIAEEGAQLDILFNNPLGIHEIYQCTFENTNIGSTASNLYFSGNEIINGLLSVSGGSLTVEESNFVNSNLNAAFGNTVSNFVDIIECSFNNTSSLYNAIEIESYSSFSIQNCTISNYGGSGIVLMNSGDNAVANRIVIGNSITNNSQYEDWSAGILVYNSYAKIHNNSEITHNAYGIQSLDNSHVSVKGDSLAHYSNQTQQIANNSYNQIYASQGCFPYYLRWNTIMATDNSCLVYYDKVLDGPAVDVRGNYWGPGFVAQDDLCPQLSYYLYKPIWPLVYVPIEDGDNASTMYEIAQNEVENGDYTSAINDFQAIIATFPETEYALYSMKEIFSLEKSTNQNFSNLQTYFQSLNSTEDMLKLGSFLSNECDVELQNWNEAISWLESIIENPASYSDSLFAIIDLETVYQKMNNSELKSSVIGKYPQFKKSSDAEYKSSKEYHLSLLFKKDELNDISKDTEYKSNYFEIMPNPASDHLIVKCEIPKSNEAQIIIYNTQGRTVMNLKNLDIHSGLNTKYINISNLPSGIYMCQMKVEDVTITKRLVVEK